MSKTKRLLPLLLIPLLLTSCERDSLSLKEARKVVSKYSTDTVYPYYKVFGKLDFNGDIIVVDGVEFWKEPSTDKFVPYARYNEGFFNSVLDPRTSDFDILVYGMASRSYWLRAPLRINSDNFFAYGKDKYTGEYTKEENNTCAHYLLEHIITSFAGEKTDPGKKMYIEKLGNGGIAFGGDAVHTVVKIDNYPCYPDYDSMPELGTWSSKNPLPCYWNLVNGKVNIRFEYNKDGWLVSESMSTVGYDPKPASRYQVALKAKYVYDFGPNP